MPVQKNRVWRLAAVASFAALAASTRPAAAQTSKPVQEDHPIAPFSSFYISAGTMLVDVSMLNPHFERTDITDPTKRPGFYALSNDAYTVGIGGYFTILNKLLIGAEFHSADVGQESSPSGKTNQLTTTYWMGTIGYAAFTTWRLNIYPVAGVGLGTETLILKNRTGGSTVSSSSDPTFDDVIANPGFESRMIGSYVMVQPGLGIDYLVLGDDKSERGVVLGVRMGTALSPNRTTWKYQGREVFGGPDAGPVGGMLRVSIGFGGFRLGGSAAPKR